MKKIAGMILGCLLISCFGMAQDRAYAFRDSTLGKLEHKNWEDGIMLDVVYNDWHGDRAAFQSPISSIGFNLSFMNHWNLTKNGAISFGVGLGYSYFKNRSFVQYNRNFVSHATILSAVDTLNEPNKVQFGANYIEIPIDFRFITKGENHFKFMIGAKIGINVRSYSKRYYRKDGRKYTSKMTNFPDLNLWRYGVTARIGMRNISLFGAYYFSSIFTNNSSTTLYPFSLGITVSLY